MPSLKDLRNRIASVGSTKKITKAMQMVAAAKLKRAQEAAISARPYANRMAAVIANLTSASQNQGSGPKLLTGTGSDQKHLIVVMTAERGLCGGFNSSVVKKARTVIRDLLDQDKQVQILTIGKKGREQLSGEFAHLMIDHIEMEGGDLSVSERSQKVGTNLSERFEASEYDVCTLIYSRFASVLSQVPTAQQLVPILAPEDAPGVDLNGASYIYEPSEEAILQALLPRYINTQILSAMLESAAGEQGARMTAMDNATRNAGDMIGALSLQYNRARQAMITKELIEIISGAEAL